MKNSIYNNSSDFEIKFVDTVSMQNCRINIEKILLNNENKINPVLRTFIINHVPYDTIHLGFTGLYSWDIEISTQVKKATTVNIENSYSSSIYKNSAGVYIIIIDESSYYIGSSINISGRFKNHYKQYSKGYPEIYTVIRNLGGISKVIWSPLYTMQNFLSTFYSIHGTILLTNFEKHLLKILTLYFVRAYEQAFISAINPTLNIQTKVSFPSTVIPTSIYTGNLNVNLPHPIKVKIKNSISYIEFDSIKSASVYLDVDVRSLYQIINYPKNFIYSPVLKEFLSVVDENSPIQTIGRFSKKVLNKIKMNSIINFDPTKLKINKIYAFDKDGNIITYFSTYTEAAKECNLNSRSVVAWNVNHRFIKCTFNGVVLDIIFGENPLSSRCGNSRPIIILDNTTNIAYSYPNITVMAKAMGISNGDRSSFVEKFITKKSLFKGRFQAYFSEDFIGDTVNCKRYYF